MMWTTCILKEDLVADEVKLLHVKRSLSMMYSGSDVVIDFTFRK
jgi:hypothetical protein